MTKKRKHVLWSNYDLDPKDWQDFLKDNNLLEADEYDQYNAIWYLNQDYLDDERFAFRDIDKMIPYVDLNNCRVIAIADLGLWDGHHSGYKMFNSLDEVLYTDCEYAEWYCDGYHLRSRESHHDGNNYITYYLFVGEGSLGGDKFLEDLYYGHHISKARWHKYTRSIRPYIKEYYGW